MIEEKEIFSPVGNMEPIVEEYKNASRIFHILYYIEGVIIGGIQGIISYYLLTQLL